MSGNMSSPFPFQKQINNDVILPLWRKRKRWTVNGTTFWHRWDEWKIPMATRTKYLPLSCLCWAHVSYSPAIWRRYWQLVMQTAGKQKWGHGQCLPLGRKQGSQLGYQTYSGSKHGFALQCCFEHNTHLPSNITVCILIFPGKYWQLYYPTNINCAFVSVSVQPVHWKCVLASVQNYFSAPKEIFIVIKACWDYFQFIHNCF